MQVREQVEQIVLQVMGQYADRDTDPGRRPDGGWLVRLFVAASAAPPGTGENP